MSPSSLTAVAIFLKYPEPGKVKTRLAKDIGTSEATAIYERMLARVLDLAETLSADGFQPVLLCDPFRSEADYAAYFSGRRIPRIFQRGEGLGERLTAAFTDLFQKYAQVVAIGTDCVSITHGELETAREKMRAGTDVVIGPATDGGYYLIGTRRLIPEIFRDIAWSTESVTRDTLKRAAEEGLTSHLLRELHDIDTKEDLAFL